MEKGEKGKVSNWEQKLILMSLWVERSLGISVNNKQL